MTPRICVVGAGIAGLSFAWHLSRVRPEASIDVLDPGRPVPGAGVVLSPDKVEEYPEFFAPLHAEIQRWNSTWIRAGDYRGWSGGHETLGVARQSLVDHMRRQVRRLDTVTWRTGRIETPPSGYDLIVGADGASSTLRRQVPATEEPGRLAYLWCSVRGRLSALFDVVPLDGGHLVVHGYPYSPERSTLVLEAEPTVLWRNGLSPDVDPDGWVRRLDALMATRLGCADLRRHTSCWQPFVTVRCARWTTGALVLVGDAAHAMHFSVGSGTSFAFDDGRALAEHVAAGTVAEFESTRRERVDAMAREAEISRRWFERLATRRHLDGVRTAFALRSRRSTNDVTYLTERDPAFVARAVAALGVEATPRRIPSPRRAPLTIGAVSLAGRVVRSTSDSPHDVPYAAELGPGHGRREHPRGLVVRDLTAAAQARDADFLAVPSAPGGRLTATELADTVRGQVDRPVLLLDAHRLGPADVDTQIIAGAFDLYAAVDDAEMSGLAPGTTLTVLPKEPSR